MEEYTIYFTLKARITMRRIIVDSGSSIKVDEKEMYGVEILPIQLQMGNDFFWDSLSSKSDALSMTLRWGWPVHAAMSLSSSAAACSGVSVRAALFAVV